MSFDSTRTDSSDPKLHMRVLKTRTICTIPFGHVLGFSEMLLEEAQEHGRDNMRPELETCSTAQSR